ncbi:hypothetical protein F53441_6766 [Fusarium austroafricanum]|uniref:Ankyrin repeat protein n=1 Tax=Fusarium austroafricanum TaxID=2364996 RepID=A0A8H4NZ67_9HYPO|nr:hypothetical protein F53441_6766 [Fusarium austroafricanum]
MMSLCRVNKAFYHMTMEAIEESDILRHVGYWDPICRKPFFYESDQDNDDPFDYDDDESELGLPHWFRPSYSADIPSNTFWINYLMKRTLGKIKKTRPTRDHLLLRKVAEYIWRYKSRGATCSEITFESVMRTVCEAAVYHGYIYDRRQFFIGVEELYFDFAALHLDESCATFRDALIVMAVYMNDMDLLEDVLSQEYSFTCPNDIGYPQWRQPEDPPFDSRYPPVQRQIEWKNGFKPPYCGKSLIRLGNAIKVAVQTDNMECTLVLLQCLTNHMVSLRYCREDIVTEVSLPRQIDFLRLAIESGPCLTENYIILPTLEDQIEMQPRGMPGSRCRGGVEISKMLEKTTNLEIFNLAYDAILAGYIERERVWWIPLNLRYEFDTLASWGVRRLQRAVLHDCLPIAQRLLELGYNLGPTRSLEELKEESRDDAEYMIDRERTRDTALPIAARRGNLEMVKLLFEAGAQKNRKNVRKAIRIAMEQENKEMLEILMSKGNSVGLLNKKAKRRWGRDLKDQGRQDMLAWLEMM